SRESLIFAPTAIAASSLMLMARFAALYFAKGSSPPLQSKYAGHLKLRSNRQVVFVS
ncbi:MAG: hypothetical protein ACI88G_002317, partial [Woeseiaceae bacterium]